MMKRQLSTEIREAFRNLFWVATFAAAFAWVESAVVVYLREIYFDGGFQFPLVVHWNDRGEHVVNYLVNIEYGREISTIIMLIAVGWAAGRTRWQRFCFFMIAFGVWDIFYYIWLRVMVDWPAGLMTWDLLFFVPLPWVGPVITPVLIAVAMIVAGSLIIFYEAAGYRIHFKWYDWAIEFGCAVLLIVSFCWDWKNIMRVPDGVFRSGIPNPFAWWLYLPVYHFAVIYFAVRLWREISKPNG